MKGLRKATVWWVGMVVLAGLGLFAILRVMESTANTVIGAIVWLVGLGLGAQVLDSVQTSIWFRPEMQEKKKEEVEPGYAENHHSSYCLCPCLCWSLYRWLLHRKLRCQTRV